MVDVRPTGMLNRLRSIPLAFLAWLPLVGATNLFLAITYHFINDLDTLAVFAVLGGSLLSVCIIRMVPFARGLTPWFGIGDKLFSDAQPPIASRRTTDTVAALELLWWNALVIFGYFFARYFARIRMLNAFGLPFPWPIGTALVFLLVAATIGRSLSVIQGFVVELRRTLGSLGHVSHKLAVVLLAYGYGVLLYAGLYRVLSIRTPDAFARAIENFGDALYFSAITMATVGYGDIVPRSMAAKLIVISEVGFGLLLLVFAVAVVMAKQSDGK